MKGQRSIRSIMTVCGYQKYQVSIMTLVSTVIEKASSQGGYSNTMMAVQNERPWLKGTYLKKHLIRLTVSSKYNDHGFNGNYSIKMHLEADLDELK